MGIEKYRCLAAYTSQMGSAIFAYTPVLTIHMPILQYKLNDQCLALRLATTSSIE